MTFITKQQDKNCLIACSEDKVNAGLCDCINRMEIESQQIRKLKRSKKNLYILEAGYIYCKRRDIEYTDDKFIEDIWQSDQFDNNEFNNICKDLRCYRHIDSYQLIEITNDEYEMCVDEFVKK